MGTGTTSSVNETMEKGEGGFEIGMILKWIAVSHKGGRVAAGSQTEAPELGEMPTTQLTNRI
jgi:hypothetical protein